MYSDWFKELIMAMAARNGSEHLSATQIPNTTSASSTSLNAVLGKLNNSEYSTSQDIISDVCTILSTVADEYGGQPLAAKSLQKFFEFNTAMVANTSSLSDICVITSPRIKLVALDMDGTLLNNHHQLTERAISVLRRLSSSGVIIALATGRSVVNILPYVEQLHLPQLVLPAVCYNGALGLQFFKASIDSQHLNEDDSVKSLIFENGLSIEEAKMMIEFSERNGFVLQYYNADNGDCYAVPTRDEHHTLLSRYAALVSRKQVLLSSYTEALDICTPAKILILDTNTDLVMSRAADQLPPNMFNMFRGSPDPYFVEFLKQDASKGNGLKRVCERLGVDMQHVVAFGDGENDKEMLEFAGIGIAMRNAKEEPLDAANLILEWTNDEDGVARQLEYMESKGWFDTSAGAGETSV